VSFHLHRGESLWRLRGRQLTLGSRTLVMGVVNLTLDSFSDGGRFLDSGLLNSGRAVAHALQLLDEGADLLDLGAESTRPGAVAGDPGSAAVSADEEQARLLPVLEAVLKERPGTILSVDTYKAATARAAVAAGAEIVNDVSGFIWDREMAAACAELRCGVIAMHTRGTPQEWSQQTRLAGEELISMVRSGLAESMRIAAEHGIDREAVVLDPGYGFGKRGEENYALLARQAELLELGRPLLAGLSRKSFLGRTVQSRVARGNVQAQHGAKARESSVETASVAALVTAILQGASIVRVHAVRAAVEAAAIADAVLAAE
jgi:dihydropteroate synthase